MFTAMWEIVLALAPWLLLGSVVAGALHVLLPRDFVRRQLSGRWAVLKAVSLGIPLPLCSCGVIPAGLGLRKDGASDGAAVGFLISTPQTGVDSILVSASFLGWPFAMFKVAAALVTGLAGGILTDLGRASTETGRGPREAPAEGRRTARAGIGHSIEILRTIWGWIVFGIVASAAIELWVPESFFTGLADRGALLPVLAVLLISLPLYVCATASVPIAAALVAGGMPAGAALVFLMAGPATNVATMGAIYRVLGTRALAAYLGSLVGGSVLAGLLFDSMVPGAAEIRPHLHGEPSWWAVGSAVLLVGLLAWFALGDLRGLWRRRNPPGTSAGATTDLNVSGMTCQSCVSRLERAFAGQDGVTSVSVSLEPGRAVVRGSIPEDNVRRIIQQAGFTVVDGLR